MEGATRAKVSMPGFNATSKRWRWLISLLLAALFAYGLSRQKLPLLPAWSSFSWSHVWAFSAGASAWFGAHVMRTLRWRWLMRPLQPLTWSQLIALAWPAFVLVLLLPLRLGEFARPWLTRQHYKLPFSAVLATVMIERLIDACLASWVLALALWGLSLPDTMAWRGVQRLAPWLALLFALLWLILMGGLVTYARWQGTIKRWLVRRNWGGKLVSADLLEGFWQGFRVCLKPKLLLMCWFESALYWGLHAMGIWLLVQGCHIDLSVLQALAMSGLLALGLLLPAGPGLLGAFQAVVYLALSIQLDADALRQEGAWVVFLLYAMQLTVVVIPGIWVWLKSKHPAQFSSSGSPDYIPLE